MKKQTRILAIATGAFLLFVLLIVGIQLIIFAESDLVREASIFAGASLDAPYRIAIDVTRVDTLNGELTLRVDIIPDGRYLDAQGQLSEKIVLIIESLSGAKQFVFEEGSSINPFTATIQILGKPSDYPLDRYSAYLALRLHGPESDDEQILLSPRIPFIVAISSDIPGYSLEFADLLDEINDLQVELEEVLSSDEMEENIGEEKDPDAEVIEEDSLDVVSIAKSEKDLSDENSFVGILVEVTHSGVVLAFIIFLMLLQWVLAFIAFIIALSTIIQKRDVKIINFSWLGALLFAQIALRNAMPGTPKVGTLGDSLSFFWVLGIITISMLVLVGVWIFRGE